jgi:16S rRNA (adenine1518-N6/adenine1519-N6)-dimethyltransferase
VIAVEIDPLLVERLRERYRGEARLTVIAADVLETNLAQWGPAVVAGNLPYYITSPVIQQLLAHGGTLRRAVLLIQAEVAERLAASPGTRDYGYLTVHARLFARPEILFRVPPSAFHPPPKVDSAAVRLEMHSQVESLRIDDPGRFLKFVGRCFKQKRKTIRNNLAETYGKEAVGAWPEASLRAEQLSIEQFAEMYRRIVR